MATDPNAPPAPASSLPPPPRPPLRHHLRRYGSTPAMVLAVIAAAGAIVANASRTAHDIKPGRAGLFWSGVLISQVFGLAALPLAIAALSARRRHATRAAIALAVALAAGFAGFSAFFSG